MWIISMHPRSGVLHILMRDDTQCMTLNCSQRLESLSKSVKTRKYRLLHSDGSRLDPSLREFSENYAEDALDALCMAYQKLKMYRGIQLETSTGIALMWSEGSSEFIKVRWDNEAKTATYLDKDLCMVFSAAYGGATLRRVKD